MQMPLLDLTYPRPEIAVVTLNRPEKLNALSRDLVESLHATIDEIAASDECRVVVLTGAGRGFCSGLDLTDPTPPSTGSHLEFPRSGMRWQERIAELTESQLSQRGSARSSSNSASADATSASATRCRASSVRDPRST
jgi:enoyl-CoA hydratase/carnithine racemase